MKKIVCINKSSYVRLTFGKTYNVISEELDLCLIVDNNGKECWCFKKWFKTLSEIRKERNETINKLLEK